MPYILEPMQEADINEVAEVERQCFATPWPISAYRRELRNPAANRYLVVRWVHPNGRQNGQVKETAFGGSLRRSLSRMLPGVFHEPEPSHSPYQIVGFGGLWLMPDEAHITTIGVAPSHRGKGLGELLLLGMTDIAIEHGATWLTLEVRVSNSVAQALYRKYTMQATGIRKHYYSDNGEDAYIMTAGPMQTQSFKARLEELRAALAARMRGQDAAEAASPTNNQ